MDRSERNIKKVEGLYLVIDAGIPATKLLSIIEQALQGGVDILQFWSDGKEMKGKNIVSKKALILAHQYGAKLLIANDIDLCEAIGADGVHFDGYELPSISPDRVKERIGADRLVGVTCGKNKEKLLWAEQHGADYVSFCSMFPSSSVNSCEIVPLEMIRVAKQLLSIPVCAAGGITLQNIDQVLAAGADGIAVVSAIQKAKNPKFAAQQLKSRITAHLEQHTSWRMNT